VLALLIWPTDPRANLVVIWAGVVLTAIGETIRLWGVHHIGTVSRTRADRLGPLISTGPFGIVRNPLYLGNITMWVGFALVAGLPWMAAIAAVLLGAEYHAIVRWEEALLEARFGETYRGYAARVPRWLPARPTTDAGPAERETRRDPVVVSAPNHERFSWSATLFSERGTLIAMAAGYFLLWLKARS